MPTEARSTSRSNEVADRIEMLFREDGARLWRSLLLSTGNRDVASDAVAEAFAQALRRGTDLRDPKRWIWRTAFRLAAAEMKQWRNSVPLADTELALDHTLVELMDALRQLTAHQRTSVVLADYAGYSHRDIARMLESTASAVAVHVHRGRRKLRTLLEVHDA